jgi:PKD repeat protein
MSYRKNPVARALSGLALVGCVYLMIGAPAAAAGYRLVGWNNLGMHCMDPDFGVLSLLPPYNTIHAQLVDSSGKLVVVPGGITVTYEGIADATGSINTTSAGKTNFWQYAKKLFGADLAVDQGLAGKGMPGSSNVPQPMTWDAAARWWVAEGIPIIPFDDAGRKNPYPMMKLVARNSSGQILASTSIVLPVSDEMSCAACHASGAGPAAKPAGGWVNDPDPARDYRLNILKLHDERFVGSPTFAGALAAAGYSPSGLSATVAAGTPILCAKCHASAALAAAGFPGVPSLTSSVHLFHGHAIDPVSGQSLDSSSNRTACYSCHPGAATKCLRGAMGSAVAADGSMEMQCQGCHGSMSAVGTPTRQGWLDEPGCGNCHTGTATKNSGQIRFASAFDSSGHLRSPADPTFATNANTPSTGLSLYRFSKGHGGVACEACHGSTHAESPSSHANDNVQPIAAQGHVGPLIECTSCHSSSPSTTSGGPHGMHPIGSPWVSAHPDVAERGAAPCQVCHGTDYRGTVLSRAQGSRTLTTSYGTLSLWRGFQISCWACHNGPSGGGDSRNGTPVASNGSATTEAGRSVAIPLSASDPDGNPLVLRIVGQPAHGTVALAGSTATFFADSGFAGSDAFTFAAWDGLIDSNLATVALTVTAPACTLSLSANAPPAARTGEPVGFHSTATGAGCGSIAYDWDFGDGSPHSTEVAPVHTFAAAGTFHWTVVVRSGAATASADGNIEIAEPVADWVYIFFISHSPGIGDTRWRTELVVLNAGSSRATGVATFSPPGGTPVSKGIDLEAGHAVRYDDAVLSLFALPSDATGPVLLAASAPLVVTSRIYTDSGSGTLGQGFAAVAAADCLPAGGTALLPQLRGEPFRTNIGALNLGSSPTDVAVKFFSADGLPVGTPLSLQVPAGGWVASNRIFDSAGLGTLDFAWATVEIQAGPGPIWAYASIVDNATGDPTTIGMVRR